MSASTVRCHILEGDVTVVSDLAGSVTNVICPEFNRLTHTCHKKRHDQGFLTNIAARVADRLSGSRANYCEFSGPDDSPVTDWVEGLRRR